MTPCNGATMWRAGQKNIDENHCHDFTKMVLVVGVQILGNIS